MYYGATFLEAQLCADEAVVVVGGGNAAGQGLTQCYARHTTANAGIERATTHSTAYRNPHRHPFEWDKHRSHRAPRVALARRKGCPAT